MVAAALLASTVVLSGCGRAQAALSTSACQSGDLPGYSGGPPRVEAKPQKLSPGTIRAANWTLHGDAAQFPIFCTVVDMRSAEAVSRWVEVVTPNIKKLDMGPAPGVRESPRPLLPVGQFDVVGVPRAAGFEGDYGRWILFRVDRYGIVVRSGYSSESDAHHHDIASRNELTIEARDTYERLQ
jgi:hypothetical protein